MTSMAIPPVLAGDFLRKAREYASLTQADLATILGLDSRTVRDAEKAARPLKPERIFAWALATGVDPTWLQWNIDACGQADMSFDFRVPAIAGGGALRACRDSNPKPSDSYASPGLRLVGRCRCRPGVHRQGAPDTRWVLAA